MQGGLLMSQSLPFIETDRVCLRFLNKSEANLALEYFSKNKDHLKETMPSFSPSFFELPFWEDRLEKNINEFTEGKSCRFFITSKNDDKVLGSVNFTEIVRGVYQGCFLGYGIDKDFQGKGIMTESLKPVIEYVFQNLNIHKILANYMPWNKSSARILEKLGFHEVGLAKEELYLSGKWQDHIETRLINQNWRNTIEG